MGKRPYRCLVGIYPDAFFSPGPADPIHPTMAERDDAETQHNDTMASPRGPGAIIASRAVRLILSGIPLSLIYPHPQKISKTLRVNRRTLFGAQGWVWVALILIDFARFEAKKVAF